MNPVIYHSGCDRPKFAALIASEGGAVMISPPQKALTCGMRQVLKSSGVRAVLDSGGFQGQADPQAYADILLSVHEYFEWFPNLDKIGDQEQSNKNFDILRQLLPSELHPKLVWVYQNGDMAMLHKYCQRFKFIGIGGLVPMAKDYDCLKSHLSRVGAVLQEHGTSAHVFGVTGVPILKWLATQSWFQSTDSTRWLSGFRHRETFDTQGKSISLPKQGFMFTPEEMSRNSIRVLHHILASEPQEQSHRDRLYQLNLLELIA